MSSPDDYYVDHRPDPTGPRLYEADRSFPDIYDQPRLYAYDAETDAESFATIAAAHGNPDLEVKIYRSVPHDVYASVPDPADVIRPGDWVSTSRAYAARHGMHSHDESLDWPVAEKTVPARDLTTEGNSVNEWGYFPQ